jgi:nitrogen fixation protein NifT
MGWGGAVRRHPVVGIERRIHMPNVMIRVKDGGALLFYIAKKDQEDEIASVEKDTETEWGGEVELTDGSRYYIDPISPRPSFPTTLRFKRAE